MKLVWLLFQQTLVSFYLTYFFYLIVKAKAEKIGLKKASCYCFIEKEKKAIPSMTNFQIS